LVEGDLIQDRVDGRHFFIMSKVPEYQGGLIAYYDGTLYLSNATCTIQRFATNGDKNAFGRDTDPAPQTVLIGGTVEDGVLVGAIPAVGVRIMINPLAFAEVEQRDQLIPKDKIKVAVQSRYGVKVHDRLVTDSGDCLRVVSADPYSLSGLQIFYVDEDLR
jgi:hypothetical protein